MRCWKVVDKSFRNARGTAEEMGVDLKGIDKNFYREKEMLPPLLPPFIFDGIWAHLSVNWQNRNAAAPSAMILW